jgi:hypothetical protein
LEAGEERRASAAWDGFGFFTLTASGFGPTGERAASRPMIFRKYVPRTGSWGEADLDYLTITAPDGPPPEVRSVARGTGRFAFNAARWEDMPTQYPIVNALAALPLEEFGPAMLVHSSGGGDASGQRILT